MAGNPAPCTGLGVPAEAETRHKLCTTSIGREHDLAAILGPSEAVHPGIVERDLPSFATFGRDHKQVTERCWSSCSREGHG